jgi:hypothetical protein
MQDLLPAFFWIRMWCGILSALSAAGTAEIFLLSIGRSTITHQCITPAMRTTNNDSDHGTFHLSHVSWSYAITSFSFLPLPGNDMSNHQQQPQRGDPASIPALTHRHLEAVLQLLKRAQQPEVALIEQAEAQLRQIIVAIKPLSPEMLQQRLQTRRLTKQQLLDALRDGCDCLNVALDEERRKRDRSSTAHSK